MSILRLTVSGFRNLAPQQLDVGPGLTAVVGANGSGKTNLLEAVAVLGNLASFRPGPSAAWIRHGADAFALAGVLDRGGIEVEIRQDVRHAGTLARALFRGARRLGAAEYLDLFPVATLSGYDRALVWGAPEDRRRFLDRLCFQIRPEALPTLQRYRRALRHRNALLTRWGPPRSSTRSSTTWPSSAPRSCACASRRSPASSATSARSSAPSDGRSRTPF